MSFILIFVDGLGIGSSDADLNPCIQPHLNHFNCYFRDDGRLSRSDCLPVDANLNMEGLPQSATGQTTLLTGHNAAQRIGRHKQGYPNQELRELIKSEGLMGKLKQRSFQVVFINAFRPIFFKMPETMKWRLSATTIAALSANLPFMTLTDICEERAIYHDMTNACLIEKGFRIPAFTPEKAGQILANASEQYDFTLYEYFLTDHSGHKQNPNQARNEISKLDRMLTSLLDHVNLDSTCILLTSDHGNIEDLSTKSHTRNPVMTLFRGNQNGMMHSIKNLEDIAPAILKWFDLFE